MKIEEYKKYIQRLKFFVACGKQAEKDIKKLPKNKMKLMKYIRRGERAEMKTNRLTGCVKVVSNYGRY